MRFSLAKKPPSDIVSAHSSSTYTDTISSNTGTFYLTEEFDSPDRKYRYYVESIYEQKRSLFGRLKLFKR
ncbi:hypothetical protein DL89DRAFT_265091 [Linderina pennispora]|uniref:Uncharacterized protein n=1 Tax=Linderina pennispora TaxID=61395 RepID=A0A1Y1WHC0_9FUNG|nr:uncharacterized protein DL89DRAFT_265091 [Linderina pennispora]ORX72919.1 hypothetical protein DL89DRAFT_265091 [Linderina pennispora]